MAILTISEASKATGKATSTLYRHISQGKVSVSKNRDDVTVVDTSELIRVYGDINISASEKEDENTREPKKKEREIIDSQSVNGSDSPYLVKALEILEEQLKQAQERERSLLENERELREELKNEQERNRELELKMLPAGDNKKKGFFSRLFGNK